MAVKRRIVWLSDEDWAVLHAEAKAQKATTSEVIRQMARLITDPVTLRWDQRPATPAPKVRK